MNNIYIWLLIEQLKNNNIDEIQLEKILDMLDNLDDDIADAYVLWVNKFLDLHKIKNIEYDIDLDELKKDNKTLLKLIKDKEKKCNNDLSIYLIKLIRINYFNRLDKKINNIVDY